MRDAVEYVGGASQLESASKSAQLFGQSTTNSRGDIGVLQQESALEILPAVQTGPQNEMAIQQRTCLAKQGEKILAHLGCRAAILAADLSGGEHRRPTIVAARSI